MFARTESIPPLRCAVVVGALMLLVWCSGCAGDGSGEEDAASTGSANRALHLPGDAKLVVSAEGGAALMYKAPADGRVWVYDQTDPHVFARHRLREGQRYTLSPAEGQATIDGRPAPDSQVMQLNPQHKYSLYFERE